MRKEILNLTPKRFICPYCGQWHKWTYRELGFFHDKVPAKYKCDEVLSGNDGENCYSIYFDDNYLYYSTVRLCRKSQQEMNGRIPISFIREDPIEPIITFDVSFVSKYCVGSYECRDCWNKEYCNYARLGDKSDNRHIIVTFGFEFDQLPPRNNSEFPDGCCR